MAGYSTVKQRCLYLFEAFSFQFISSTDLHWPRSRVLFICRVSKPTQFCSEVNKRKVLEWEIGWKCSGFNDSDFLVGSYIFLYFWHIKKIANRSSTCDINYPACDNSRYSPKCQSSPALSPICRRLFWRQEVKTRLNFLWVSIVSWYWNRSLSDRKKKLKKVKQTLV